MGPCVGTVIHDERFFELPDIRDSIGEERPELTVAHSNFAAVVAYRNSQDQTVDGRGQLAVRERQHDRSNDPQVRYGVFSATEKTADLAANLAKVVPARESRPPHGYGVQPKYLGVARQQFHYVIIAGRVLAPVLGETDYAFILHELKALRGACSSRRAFNCQANLLDGCRGECTG